MAKLQSTEIVGVANRPATICNDMFCLWFDTTNRLPMVSYCIFNISCSSSWSAGGALITSRETLSGAGTQNEGLVMGGNITGVGSNLSCSDEYNGTSWSTGGAMIVGKYGLAGAGTQNAGLAMGGPLSLSCTEEYNGTTWSTGGVLITGRYVLAGSGTQNEGLAMGGIDSIFNPPSSLTEEYNGTGLE